MGVRNFMRTIKRFMLLLPLCLMWPGQPVLAETLFYNNTNPPVFTTSPVYFTPGTSEWADDVPFSGTQQVSSFTFGYKTSQSVIAYFRFYGVDASTGKPGTLFNEIYRVLPAGDQTQTIQLSSAEQFYFTAERGLNQTTKSGGWFSIRFESVSGGPLPYDLLVRLARGSSSDTLYNVTTGATIVTLDPDGFLPASLYLQMSSGQTVSTAGPQPANLLLTPSTVKAGGVVVGTVTLDSPASVGGVTVTLASSNNSVAKPTQNSIVIPEGETTGVFYITTTTKVGRSGKNVTITTTANDGDASAQLFVRR
jgi:hypothetical protein